MFISYHRFGNNRCFCFDGIFARLNGRISFLALGILKIFLFGNSDVTIIIIIYTLFITCILLSSDEIILMVFGLIIMYQMDCLILRDSS